MVMATHNKPIANIMLHGKTESILLKIKNGRGSHSLHSKLFLEVLATVI